MITNHSILKNAYKCNKQVMEYLVFKCRLPVLSYSENTYYFTNNSELEEHLKHMPLNLKLMSVFVR